VRYSPVLLVVAVLVGCGAEDARRVGAPAPVPFESREHRFTAALPAGWEWASRSLTPTMSPNPIEILTAGTVRGMQPLDGSCGHMPMGAIERMGPRDALVSVFERYGVARFPDRPARFALPDRIEHGDAMTCADTATRLDDYWFDFRDVDRGFHVLIVFGRDVPRERREQALALLDSLRFEPGPQGVDLDSDIAVPFEDATARLSWQMPVPPWRRYDWPMTSVQGERLSLGTFDLERRPPDRNCTPRAAIDTMPADGAFIYLFEYIDLAERWKRRFPQRTGPLTLGPETAPECMGKSRTVIWQDRGRAFQAHAYIGAHASDRLRHDVTSILNSIQAR
jgi:hypothetical protein